MLTVVYRRVDVAYIEAQRLAGWPDIHPEDYCHKCGVAFEPWFTDRETWLAGTSAWAAQTGREGICCMPCFIEMFKENTGREPMWRLSEVVTASSLTDDQICAIQSRAARDEDGDLFDACETALKMIVQPNLKQQARERIAAALNARGGK